MDKKYYWLKLDRNFFKRHDIRVVESMPNGKEYVLFYLKLLVESIDHQGELRFNDLIPYNDQMLSTITNTNIDVVRSAIKVFQSLTLLEVWDDETIHIIDTKKMLGVGKSTERVRKFREKKALELSDETLHETLHETQRNVTETLHETHIDIEKDIDIELDKELDTKQRAKTHFTPPSLNEVLEYIQEKSLTVNAQDFIDYYESNGWKVGRNKMKDWRATIRRWNNNQFKTNKRVEVKTDYTQVESTLSQEELIDLEQSLKNIK